MATDQRTVPAGRTGRVLLLVLRVLGAGLLAAMAGIHVYLYQDGYRDVPTIGLLFLLNGIGGGLLTLAVAGTPNRFLGPLAGLSALFTAGTLGGLVLSLNGGLFGFQEALVAPLVTTTLAVESAGVLVLAALTVLALAGRRGPRAD